VNQSTNVTVINRGCGSGCASTIGFLLLLGLAFALIGAFIRYWYITGPIAVVMITLGIIGAREVRRKSANQHPNRHVIDVTESVPLQLPDLASVRPDVSVGQAPPPPVIEPGWKTDPSDPSHIAYWDGMQYSAHKRWNGSEWVDS